MNTASALSHPPSTGAKPGHSLCPRPGSGEADWFGASPSGTRRRVVSRAEALILSRPDAAVSSRELARAVGVSVRSLFRAFEEARGYGPCEARLRARLAHVRSELLAGSPGATVTEIAQSWGFVHLGRFAAVYRRYFGEKPSDTLRARVHPRARLVTP